MNEPALNIIHINIQSLRNKLDNLNELIHTIETNTNKKLHVIALSEIWIYDNENEYYNMEEYNVFFSNRNNKRSGGCCIYVLKEIQSTFIKEFEYEYSNVVIIKIDKFDVKIACIYRYGKSDISKFNEKMENEVYKYKRVLIIGDFNINLKNDAHEVKKYMETFKSNGIACINDLRDKAYTRKSNSIATIIDHILTDFNEIEFNVSLIDTYLSDHRMLAVSFLPSLNQNYTIKNSKNEIKILNYDNIEIELNDKDIYVLEETSFTDFHEKIIKIIERNTNIIHKKPLKKRKSWANRELLHYIEKRDEYYKKWSKNNNIEIYKLKFDEYKIKARNLRNYLRKTYYNELIGKNINDNRKMWKIINAVMHKKNYTERESIQKIEINGKLIIDKKQMANAFNEYYINNIKPKRIEEFRQTNYENISNFEMNKCNEEEIISIVHSLNNNASNGYDNISARFIKKYDEYFSQILTKFINDALETGIYPDTLKIGCVIPIFKKGNKLECVNYRPITKLCVFDKIFEQVLLTRLQNHLNNNNIINENQFGFIKNSNTLAACTNCMENIYNLIEKNKYIALISIDLEKAFDSTNIAILINKLKEINIKETELKIFESFLSNRKQYVQIESNQSKYDNIEIGIPQGAKLAATLFIIYINGILKMKLKSIPQFYADDGLFIAHGKNYNELIENINYDIKIIHEWFNDNHLKLNIKKTKIMLIKTKNEEEMQHFIGINFDNKLIERVNSIKYLGLTIDDKLSWDEHVDTIKGKLIPICAAIFKIRNYIPRKILWQIYNAHFLSHINYLNQIWMHTKEQNINDLQRIQNKFIKIIENKHRLTPTETLYRDKMNIKKIMKYNIIILVHKIKLNICKFNFTLNTVQSVQNKFLRNILNYRPLFFKKEKCRSSILSKGMNFYNETPIDIRNINNIRLFKAKLKEYIVNL